MSLSAVSSPREHDPNSQARSTGLSLKKSRIVGSIEEIFLLIIIQRNTLDSVYYTHALGHFLSDARSHGAGEDGQCERQCGGGAIAGDKIGARLD